MEIAAPQLLRESAASADPVRMTRDEEIADASFRAADFASLDREHLSVQGCLFTGCLFAGSVLARSQFSDVVFRNCDFSFTPESKDYDYDASTEDCENIQFYNCLHTKGIKEN